MTTPTRFRITVAAFAVALLGSCKPPPEIVRVKEPVSVPADLVKQAPPSLADHAYQLRAFHLNHIWSGTSPHTDASETYRAKITVWDYADDESVIAELYFDDIGRESTAPNPDPSKTPRPYRIHFPMATCASIIGTLRGTNEPIFLYYYNGSWAIGSYSPEPVGAD